VGTKQRAVELLLGRGNCGRKAFDGFDSSRRGSRTDNESDPGFPGSLFLVDRLYCAIDLD